MEDLKGYNIHLSARGKSIRVSPNVYNDAEDVNALITVLGRHF